MLLSLKRHLLVIDKQWQIIAAAAEFPAHFQYGTCAPGGHVLSLNDDTEFMHGMYRITSGDSVSADAEVGRGHL